MEFFSKNAYLELLNYALKKGFSFAPLSECEVESVGPRILLRHDVDFSLQYAVEMARLERSLGIRSSYYILLYGEFYNPFSESGRRLINEISELGHEIGLHWDSKALKTDKDDLESILMRDIKLLEGVSGKKVLSASQHIPIDSPYFDIKKFIKYEAYCEPISNNFPYISDSSMRWRNNTPYDFVEKGNSFQLLIHPIWWMADGVNSDEKLRSVANHELDRVSSNLESFIKYMDQCLRDREKLDENFRARSLDKKM